MAIEVAGAPLPLRLYGTPYLADGIPALLDIAQPDLKAKSTTIASLTEAKKSTAWEVAVFLEGIKNKSIKNVLANRSFITYSIFNFMVSYLIFSINANLPFYMDDVLKISKDNVLASIPLISFLIFSILGFPIILLLNKRMGNKSRNNFTGTNTSFNRTPKKAKRLFLQE